MAKVLVDEIERAKILAAAEMLCDFFEYIVHGRDTMAAPIRKGWFTYMKVMYQNNECFKYYFENYKNNYTDELAQIITAPQF